MKIKMFKKIIAALCAATMSMSAISSVGAIKYTGSYQCNNEEIKFVKNTNIMISQMCNNISEMKNIAENMKSLSKYEIIDNLNDTYNTLINMLGDNLCSPSKTIVSNFNAILLPVAAKIKRGLAELKNYISKKEGENKYISGFGEYCKCFNYTLARLYKSTKKCIHNYQNTKNDNMNMNNMNMNNMNMNNMNMNNMNMNNMNMMNNKNNNMNFNMMNNMNMNNMNMNTMNMNNMGMNNMNMNMMNNMNMNNMGMNNMNMNMMNNKNNNMNFNMMNNMVMMNNMEMQWKALTSDNKKNCLNKLLHNNDINIQLANDAYNWNHSNVQKFIDNATFDDVSKLPSFIKALVGKTLEKELPDMCVLCYQNGKLYFWDNKYKRAKGLMPFLGTLCSIALNNPQIFDTIPNKQQYSHLIETLKKC